MIKQKNSLKILGSVSPYSIKNDNCPGYLLSVNNQKILLDCGFGVCKELNIPDDFNNLNIFISHFHKDHYIDIYALAYASYVYNKLGLLQNRIKVYIPKTSENDLEYLDYLLLTKLEEHYFEFIEYDNNSVIKIDDVLIDFIKNYHSINTYSTRIKFDNKLVVYSSDLGFKTNDSLVEFAKGANVLLIESSFAKSDNQQSEYHLHAYEAAMIAKEANVDKLFLTHFWPAHNKIIYLDEARQVFKNTYISKNNKVIRL